MWVTAAIKGTLSRGTGGDEWEIVLWEWFKLRVGNMWKTEEKYMCKNEHDFHVLNESTYIIVWLKFSLKIIDA